MNQLQTNLSLMFTARQAKRRRGAMMLLILVLMVGFMVTVAFSVDVAQMHLTRTEVRTATDAAAKAAASELSRTQDIGQAIQRGKEIALENTVNGEPLIVATSDFSFGRSEIQNNGRFQFRRSQTPINSVRVNGRRTAGSPSGPVPLFFGNFLGVDTFEPQSTAAATFIERDVSLVIDRSGSMRGQRYRDLVGALQVFVDTLAETPVDERVSLASYSSSATRDVELTTNLPTLVQRAGALRVSGSTSISRGMNAGSAQLLAGRDTRFVEQTMIVMTDGRHNSGPDPLGSAVSLAGRDVTIHAITFGFGADQSRMRQIAAIGGGKHFHAVNGAQLREIYREIALTLNTIMTE